MAIIGGSDEDGSAALSYIVFLWPCPRVGFSPPSSPPCPVCCLVLTCCPRPYVPVLQRAIRGLQARSRALRARKHREAAWRVACARVTITRFSLARRVRPRAGNGELKMSDSRFQTLLVLGLSRHFLSGEHRLARLMYMDLLAVKPRWALWACCGHVVGLLWACCGHVARCICTQVIPWRGRTQRRWSTHSCTHAHMHTSCARVAGLGLAHGMAAKTKHTGKFNSHLPTPTPLSRLPAMPCWWQRSAWQGGTYAVKRV